MKIISLLILTFCFSAVYSQKSVEDLLEKAKKALSSNPDSSFFYCNEASKIKNSSFEGEVLICQARYLLLKSDYARCELNLSKAISIFKSKNNLEQLSNVYSLKSLLSQRIGDKENEKKYLKMAYEIDKKRETIEI